DALLGYLGIPRVHDLPTFLETLMLLHCNGALTSSALSSISCSGGEASLIADIAASYDVHFPDLTAAQKSALAKALGPMVSLSNPLDYHTYIWNDLARMTAAWLPMAADHIGLTLILLDYPHTDATAWENATRAAINVRRASGQPVAVVATLPELLPDDVVAELIAAGVTPLRGMAEALGAAAAAQVRVAAAQPPLLAGAEAPTTTLSEAQAKAVLAAHGVTVPQCVTGQAGSLDAAARNLPGPFAVKSQGIAHKSEAGALRLGVAPDELDRSASEMPGQDFLVESMVQGVVAELLVGVVRDLAHGFVMTLAAGGVLTELWQDRVSMLLPVERDGVAQALTRLRIYPLLTGYRGAAAVHMPALVDAVLAVQTYVMSNQEQVYEVEINPLMCTASAAIAADALIVCAKDPTKAGE
ncbi:MAG: acetate--CoA ligase family protein, partial [Roseobacter sp.]|nr:acetate--CoA ligase family protein [Roseobacter sp.]